MSKQEEIETEIEMEIERQMEKERRDIEIAHMTSLFVGGRRKTNKVHYDPFLCRNIAISKRKQNV